MGSLILLIGIQFCEIKVTNPIFFVQLSASVYIMCVSSTYTIYLDIYYVYLCCSPKRWLQSDRHRLPFIYPVITYIFAQCRSYHFFKIFSVNIFSFFWFIYIPMWQLLGHKRKTVRTRHTCLKFQKQETKWFSRSWFFLHRIS